MTEHPLLAVEGLTVGYGEILALRDVWLQVAPRTIVALIGANGAGKTTLLNAIAGVIPPRVGTVRLDGRPITGLPPEPLAAQGVAYVPERRQLFSTMTVADNLLLGAYARLKAKDREGVERTRREVYDTFPILWDRRHQMAGVLSGGEQQMLALARGLMGSPRLLLLDEPSLGLAPRVVQEIMRVIAALRSRGLTILLAEQNARAALATSDAAYVLDTGRMVMEGESRALAADPRVRAAYLGRMAMPARPLREPG